MVVVILIVIICACILLAYYWDVKHQNKLQDHRNELARKEWASKQDLWTTYTSYNELPPKIPGPQPPQKPLYRTWPEVKEELKKLKLDQDKSEE